jgi:hypothetical protein
MQGKPTSKGRGLLRCFQVKYLQALSVRRQNRLRAIITRSPVKMPRLRRFSRYIFRL